MWSIDALAAEHGNLRRLPLAFLGIINGEQHIRPCYEGLVVTSLLFLALSPEAGNLTVWRLIYELIYRRYCKTLEHQWH